MPYRIHDINIADDGDMQRLADMLNDFDSAWPGGFNRGRRDTVATVREHLRRSRRAAVLAVETDGEFVGYCDLKPFPGAPDMVYVDLLGARLSHHGRGVGRMLLLEMVRRACVLGARLVTLDTWAGNTKAVPLYKRTGFQWKPDTDVHMQNYIPTILASPYGRRFFDGADWYACHERDTDLEPDDERWHGMPVYAYRFRRDGQSLQVWIDRASGKVTGVETDRWLVGCRIPVEEVAAGETCPIEWVVASRTDGPADVRISCVSAPGISAELDEQCRIEGERTLEGSLRVEPGARHWREGEDPHLVHTTVTLDGETIQLTTGVKIVEPIEVEFSGAGLRVGRHERLTVRLRNRLDRDLQGDVSLPAHPALVCEPECAPFDLPARCRTDCEIAVTASMPGVHEGALALRAEGVRMERPVAFRAFAGGETLASLDSDHDETAIIESPSVRVVAGLRGGWVNAMDAASGRELVSVGEAELGPPFCSWRIEPRLWEGHIEHGSGGPCLVVCRNSDEIEGLRIERRIAVAGSNAVRLDHRIMNHGPADVPASLLVAPEAKLWGTFACRTNEALVCEPMHGWGHFPTAAEDVIDEGGSLAEAWSSVEADGLVCGQAWEGKPDQKHGWDSPMPSLTYHLPVIPSGGCFDAPAVYVLAGAGGWRTVREWWRCT
ncbi:MAG: GNAT family N-acetyltransferase, partial [Armatimonadetes bacterium]|nr:GNAT family N-acetyltransferase [Armatimonadota bacterium]